MQKVSEHSPLELALAEHFDFASFRPGQRQVIEAVLAGRNVMAVMPTGAGKSLCYQLPALVSGGTTLVVSPLIALMKDQVDALAARKIPAAYINSQLSAEERSMRLIAASRGAYRLLYVAPERFRSPGVVEALRQAQVVRMAVDEAHCVSQWGHDFRPEYRELAGVARQLGVEQICAFTATATPEVRRDIVAGLGLAPAAAGGTEPDLFVHGFARDNLVLRVLPVKRLRDKLAHVLALAAATEGGSGIVYCATRKNVEKVQAALEEGGVATGLYHGGLDEGLRELMQSRFMSGDMRVMVATNAFGMGIDKADIRFVAHYDMPGSLEAYYQEAGRAGRDGEPADCVLLFNYVDVRVHEFFIERIGQEDQARGRAALSTEQISTLQRLERAKLRRMIDFCYADGCRQALILRYFGERESAGECLHLCDRCLERGDAPLPAWAAPRALSAEKAGRRKAKVALGEAAEPDETQIVTLQKILSAYARARGRLGLRRMIALLRGRSRDLPEDLLQSRSHGILAGERAATLEAVIGGLLDKGALTSVSGLGGAVHRISELGVELMHRRTSFALRMPISGGATSLQPPPAEDGQPLSLAEQSLYSELVARRKAIAKEQGVPAYVVAHDAVLRRISVAQPVSADQLLEIKGMGPVKVERYGEALLSAVRVFAEQ